MTKLFSFRKSISANTLERIENEGTSGSAWSRVTAHEKLCGPRDFFSLAEPLVFSFAADHQHVVSMPLFFSSLAALACVRLILPTAAADNKTLISTFESQCAGGLMGKT